MKLSKYILVAILICGSIYGSPKKVLVEIFTNAGCPECVDAHFAIDFYRKTGAHKENVNYIFYYLAFPSPGDSLSKLSPVDANSRNQFYGPFTSTPHGVFDGITQNANYSNWANSINSYAAQESPFELSLSGQMINNALTLTANVKQTMSLSSGDLAIYFVVVENINYPWVNGISDHFNSMRKILPDANGISLAIQQNQEIAMTQEVLIGNDWNTDQLGFVVFIQDKKTKTVYQSEYSQYKSLITTGTINSVEPLPVDYKLFQNYPNPFNPETVISYQLPAAGNVNLKIYDVLGKEVDEIVNKFQNAGIHNIKFSSAGFSSGVYFYALRSGNFIQTRKMILIK